MSPGAPRLLFPLIYHHISEGGHKTARMGVDMRERAQERSQGHMLAQEYYRVADEVLKDALIHTRDVITEGEIHQSLVERHDASGRLKRTK